MAHPGQYVRYAELSLRFQDTILGHLYGVRFETRQEEMNSDGEGLTAYEPGFRR